MTSVLQIRTSSRCSRGCSFCATPSDSSSRDLSLGEISENIDFFERRYGVDEIVLSGGEVTEREDLFDLLDLLGSRRLRFTTVISSGQGWTPEIAGALGETIDRVVLSLTPGGKSDFRRTTSHFGRALSSIEMLEGTGVIVQTNTVMLPGNISVLPEVAEMVKRLGVASPIFTLPFPRGLVGEELESFAVPWPLLAPRLFEAMDITEQQKPKIKNLPLCYLGPYSRFCSRTTTRYLVQRGRQLEDRALIPPFVGLDFQPECSGCRLRERCDGFWKEYLALESYPRLGPQG